MSILNSEHPRGMLSQAPSDIIYVMKCIPDGKGDFAVTSKYCRRDRARLAPPTSALSYGRTAFGGMRIRIDKKGNPYVHYLKAHARRLRYNAKAMGILQTEVRQELPKLKLSYDEMSKIILELYEKNGKGDFTYVRPTIYREFGGLGVSTNTATGFVLIIEVVPMWDGAYYASGSEGMRVVVVNPQAFSRPSFAGQTKPAKSGGIGTYVIGGDAKDWAHANGNFNDALMQAYYPDGNYYLTDFTSTNLICIKGKELHVPESHDTFLNGIQLQIVLSIAREKGLKITTRNIQVSELEDFDEILSTGTAGGVNPVSEIAFCNSDIVLKKSIGDISKLIKTEYERGIAERFEYSIERMF